VTPSETSYHPQEILDDIADAANYNEWIWSRVQPLLGAFVLDVGAGLGTFTALAVREAERVIAIEPDSGFADLLRSRFRTSSNLEVVEQTWEGLPKGLAFDAADSVLCLNVLEHIADDNAALNAIYDALAPGGRLFLLVPAHRWLYGSIDRDVRHERRYEKRALNELLERHGFAVDELRHVNPVGAVGWFVSSRVIGATTLPRGPLRAYDRLVPLLRALDRLPLAFGLSLWAVGRRRP
jgi:SAM-dependent methyltransferase